MLKFHQALLLLVQTTIGEGVILVPYALALAGIPSGIAFLILFMIMTYYSVHLLIILKEKTLLHTIPLLAYEIFGKKGFYFFTGTLAIAQIFFTTLLNEQKCRIDYKHKLPRYGQIITFSCLTVFPILFSYWKRIDNYKYLAYTFALLLFSFPLFLLFISPYSQGDQVPINLQSESHLYSFDSGFFQTVPVLLVTFTFVPNYFQCHNSLSLHVRTQYKGMCLAFLTTVVATAMFLLISVVIILKKEYTLTPQNQVKFFQFGELPISGEVGILILLFHSPIIFFNGKDMIMTIIAQIKSKEVSGYLKRTGISQRFQSEFHKLNLGSSSHGNDVGFAVPEFHYRRGSHEINSQNNLFTSDETTSQVIPTDRPRSQKEELMVFSDEDDSITGQKNPFLNDFLTEESKPGRPGGTMGNPRKLSLFQQIEFISHQTYCRDLTIINLAFAVISMVVFLFLDQQPRIRNFISFIFSSIPLIAITYIFPALCCIKLFWRTHITPGVWMSLLGGILFLIATIPITVWSALSNKVPRPTS